VEGEVKIRDAPTQAVQRTAHGRDCIRFESVTGGKSASDTKGASTSCHLTWGNEVKKDYRMTVCASLSRSMREFGYPDVTNEMSGEILDAFIEGKRGFGNLPHGIIGGMMESQLKELADSGFDMTLLVK
jgi:hypothetical protein